MINDFGGTANMSIYSNNIVETKILLYKIGSRYVFIYNNTLTNATYVYDASYMKDTFIWYNDLGYSSVSMLGGSDYHIYFYSPYPIKYMYKGTICTGYLENYYIPVPEKLEKNTTSGLLIGNYPMVRGGTTYNGTYFLIEPWVKP